MLYTRKEKTIMYILALFVGIIAIVGICLGILLRHKSNSTRVSEKIKSQPLESVIVPHPESQKAALVHFNEAVKVKNLDTGSLTFTNLNDSSTKPLSNHHSAPAKNKEHVFPKKSKSILKKAQAKRDLQEVQSKPKSKRNPKSISGEETHALLEEFKDMCKNGVTMTGEVMHKYSKSQQLNAEEMKQILLEELAEDLDSEDTIQ